MHPEVQKRAQRELDDVVGQERIPSFEDVDRLPYIQAIVLEVTRWHTVLPYGLLLWIHLLSVILTALFPHQARLMSPQTMISLMDTEFPVVP